MTSLAYDRRGSGPPLVLVHGLGSRWQVFAPILDQLAEHRDVISIDLPGFGASPADPAVTASVLGYATRVVAFIDELGLDRPEVGGSSMGGGIALELGRRGVAGRVTAFAPVGFWTSAERRWCAVSLTAVRTMGGRLRTPFARLARHRWGRVALFGLVSGRPSRLDPDAVMADLDALVAAPSFGAAARSFAGYDVRDPAQDLGRLPDVPVTIAWGSRDAVLIYRTQSARARRALPWATHTTLRGCGHLPFTDDPQRCTAILLDDKS